MAAELAQDVANVVRRGDGGLVITRGLDRCLVIWDMDGWRGMAERIRALNTWQGEARRMQRHFFSGAVPARPDKLGRVANVVRRGARVITSVSEICLLLYPLTSKASTSRSRAVSGTRFFAGVSRTHGA